MPVSVHISEDSSELRTLLRRWLERDDRVDVVGEAGSGDDALQGLARLQPDVSLLDLSMPRSLGAEMIPAIRACSPGTRIMVITGAHLDAAHPVLTQADAYLLKPAPMPELAELVCELARERASDA